MLLRNLSETKPKYPEFARLYKGSPKAAGRSGKDLFDSYRIEVNPMLADMDAEREQFKNLKEDIENRLRTVCSVEDGAKYISAENLTIRFPFKNAADFFQWENRIDGQTKSGSYVCKRRCDGVTCSMHTVKVGDDYQKITTPTPCAAGPNDTDCPEGCKSKGRLQLFIEGIGYNSGVAVFPMGSGIDVGNVMGYLLAAAENYEAAFNEPIDYRNLLFRLSRKEGMFNAPTAGGGTIPKKNGEVFLALDTAMSRKMHEKALAAGQARFTAMISGTSTSHADDPGEFMMIGEADDDVVDAEHDEPQQSVLATYINMLDACDSEAMIESAKDWVKPQISDGATQEGMSAQEFKNNLGQLTSNARDRVAAKTGQTSTTKAAPVKKSSPAIV